jgi:hypothetical protein
MALLVVWGPTGVGKTAVLRQARAAHPDVGLIDTFTTRPGRDREVDTKVPGTPLPRDTSGLLVTPFAGEHYFNVVADLTAAAEDPECLFAVDWVHHHSVAVQEFGPYTASVVLTTSPLRTALRLARSGRPERIPAALAQSRQFRREVHGRARSDPSLGWRLVSNDARSPAATAEALIAIGRASVGPA